MAEDGPAEDEDRSTPRDAERRFGAPDVDALKRIRDRFQRHEPLVDDVAFDSATNPTTLHVRLTDGIRDPGRFDVRWSDRGYYSVHYREPDSGLECRFDRHPKPGAPEAHFHPPPDAASSVDPSCIEVALPDLVALAVIQAWRNAYEADDLGAINAVEDPP